MNNKGTDQTVNVQAGLCLFHWHATKSGFNTSWPRLNKVCHGSELKLDSLVYLFNELTHLSGVYHFSFS